MIKFEKFERIMKTLIAFQEKKGRISDFIEKELTEDSWCIFTVGNDVESALMSTLADEMNCWYCIRPNDENADKEWYEVDRFYAKENEIECWFYNYLDKDEKKIITVDEVEYDVTDLKDFYNYLVKFYLTEDKK